MPSDNTDFAVPCSACDGVERKDIDWLREQASILCTACGGEIDLRENPLRGEIHRVWNAVHHLGPARRRLP